MTDIARLRKLTDADERAHREEVLKLRRCLEQQRTWRECFIVDVEMIRPSVHVLVDLVTGKYKRELLRGGVRYKLMFPGAASPTWIEVKHWDSAHHLLYATVQPPYKPATYARIAKLIRFEDAGREFVSCIDLLQEECKPVLPGRHI